MPVCYIVGAMADALPFVPAPGDLLIAADSGLLAVEKNGLTADLVVGDFDSLGHVPQEGTVVRHPVQKDDTDMMLAVKLGLERGYRHFRLFGGLGGRTDHTLANIQTLAYLTEHGAEGWLEDARERITMLKDGTRRFSAAETGTVSVFAYGGEATGVYLSGLCYPLTDATLTPAFPIGVSNSFTGRPAEITVRHGRLLILLAPQVFPDAEPVT